MKRMALCLMLVAAAGCASAGRSAGDPTAEARAFMESYARDLQAGNREGLADRYDRRGAYMLINGEKLLEPYDSIAARYRTSWRPPATFQWEDLSYEVVGPDAVVVAGRFAWTRAGAPAVRYAYSALLLRQQGALRIRLEDESVDVRAIPRPVCRPDSARG